VPFAVTQPQRDTTKDPRRSIAERYANEDAYLEHIRAAERTLVRSRYILAEDVPAIEARALEHWRVATEAAIPSTR
jgi:hypothetical protein